MIYILLCIKIIPIFREMKHLFYSVVFICALLSAQQPDCDRIWTEFISGQYEEALVSIDQCLAHDTTNYRTFFLKGRVLENLYRHNEAVTALQKAIELNPDSREAKSALAALYLFLGQPEQSAHYYELLANAEPHLNRWKISWARALMAAGNFQDALEQLTIVEKTDTTNWLVYRYMGDCFFRIDNLWFTYVNYYKSLNINPNNKSLWGTLTGLLVTNDQIDGAIEVGIEAIAIDSTNVDAWKFLGIAYYKSGEARNTLNALEKAMSLGDSSFAVLSHYGIVNYNLGQRTNDIRYYREAEEYLEKARKLDYSNVTIMNYLAPTYGFTGKAQKGLDIIHELDLMVADFDTIGMNANIQRGHLLRRLNRNREAANAFIKATKDFPNDYENFYQVAFSYERANDKRLAIEWYSRFLEKIDPNWEERQRWTAEELNKYQYIRTAIRRIEILRTDLFFEGNLHE